jgi:hypothetical protein
VGTYLELPEPLIGTTSRRFSSAVDRFGFKSLREEKTLATSPAIIRK